MQQISSFEETKSMTNEVLICQKDDEFTLLEDGTAKCQEETSFSKYALKGGKKM